MKDTKIIAAYPGLGKSWCTRFFSLNTTKIAIDSDSSHFSWEYDDYGHKIGKNKDFPKSYINYILSYIGKADYIFISTHQPVLEYFISKENKDKYIDRFYVAIPELSDKMRNYLRDIYRDRGNDENFINDQYKHFINRVKWLNENIPPEMKVISRVDMRLDYFLHKKYGEEFTLMVG